MATDFRTIDLHDIPAPAKELMRRMTDRFPRAMPVLNEMMHQSLDRICRLYQPSGSRNVRLGLHLRDLGITPAKFDQRRLLYKLVDMQSDFDWPFTYMDASGQLKYVVMEELRGTYTFPAHMVDNLEWVSMFKFKKYAYENVWAGRLSVGNAWNDVANTLIFGYTLFPVVTQFYQTSDLHENKHFWSLDEYVVLRDDVIPNDPIFGNLPVKRGEFVPEFVTLTPQLIWDEVHNPDGLLKPTRSYKSPVTGEVTTAHVHIQSIYDKQQARLAAGLIRSEMEFVRPMTWDAHCEGDTFGQNEDPVIEQMSDLHSRTRDADVIKQRKGTGMADMFGAYSAEGEVAGDPAGALNIEMLEHHEKFDEEALSGEALYNCVIRTAEQKQEYVVAQAPHLQTQTTLLLGTSSAIGGTEPSGQAIQERLVSQGMKVEDVWDFAHGYLDRLGY